MTWKRWKDLPRLSVTYQKKPRPRSELGQKGKKTCPRSPAYFRFPDIVLSTTSEPVESQERIIFPHFIDEETEAQRREMSFPSSHSNGGTGAESGLMSDTMEQTQALFRHSGRSTSQCRLVHLSCVSLSLSLIQSLNRYVRVPAMFRFHPPVFLPTRSPAGPSRTSSLHFSRPRLLR